MHCMPGRCCTQVACSSTLHTLSHARADAHADTLVAAVVHNQLWQVSWLWWPSPMGRVLLCLHQE